MSQTEELTPAQIAKMEAIAKQVIGAYPKLELTEILNRIHFITGFDYQRCIGGFKKMFSRGMITPSFVIGIERLPALEKVWDSAFPLAVSLGLEFVKPGTFESLGTVTQLDGPTDDADEAEPSDDGSHESAHADLSHLNASF